MSREINKFTDLTSKSLRIAGMQISGIKEIILEYINFSIILLKLDESDIGNPSERLSFPEYPGQPSMKETPVI